MDRRMRAAAAGLCETDTDFDDINAELPAIWRSSPAVCGFDIVQAETTHSDAAMNEFFMNFPIQTI